MNKTAEEKQKHAEEQRRYVLRKAADPNWKLNRRPICREAERRWRQANRERHLAQQKRWREANKEQRRVNRLVKYAIDCGRLLRPDHCTKCGLVCIPEGHHEDYNKPYDVVWLCHPCHMQHHSRTRGRK